MFVLWSTQDHEEKYRLYEMPKNWEKVKKFVDDAFNEYLPEGSERRTSTAGVVEVIGKCVCEFNLLRRHTAAHSRRSSGP